MPQVRDAEGVEAVPDATDQREERGACRGDGEVKWIAFVGEEGAFRTEED